MQKKRFLLLFLFFFFFLFLLLTIACENKEIEGYAAHHNETITSYNAFFAAYDEITSRDVGAYSLLKELEEKASPPIEKAYDLSKNETYRSERLQDLRKERLEAIQKTKEGYETLLALYEKGIMIKVEEEAAMKSINEGFAMMKQYEKELATY